MATNKMGDIFLLRVERKTLVELTESRKTAHGLSIRGSNVPLSGMPRNKRHMRPK
jgi:hypothetical protein